MNGNATSAPEPMAMHQNGSGNCLRKPPILKMSCSWCSARITEPAERNSNALKNAWVIRWKIAADHAPTPSAMNM